MCRLDSEMEGNGFPKADAGQLAIQSEVDPVLPVKLGLWTF
jgi:hypothetical protein